MTATTPKKTIIVNGKRFKLQHAYLFTTYSRDNVYLQRSRLGNWEAGFFGENGCRGETAEAALTAFAEKQAKQELKRHKQAMRNIAENICEVKL